MDIGSAPAEKDSLLSVDDSQRLSVSALPEFSLSDEHLSVQKSSLGKLRYENRNRVEFPGWGFPGWSFLYGCVTVWVFLCDCVTV